VSAEKVCVLNTGHSYNGQSIPNQIGFNFPLFHPSSPSLQHKRCLGG